LALEKLGIRVGGAVEGEGVAGDGEAGFGIALLLFGLREDPLEALEFALKGVGIQLGKRGAGGLDSAAGGVGCLDDCFERGGALGRVAVVLFEDAGGVFLVRERPATGVEGIALGLEVLGVLLVVGAAGIGFDLHGAFACFLGLEGGAGLALPELGGIEVLRQGLGLASGEDGESLVDLGAGGGEGSRGGCEGIWQLAGPEGLELGLGVGDALFDDLASGEGFRRLGDAVDGQAVEGGGELVLELGELPAGGGEGIATTGLDAQQGAIAEPQFGGLRDDAGLAGGERLAVEEDGLGGSNEFDPGGDGVQGAFGLGGAGFELAQGVELPGVDGRQLRQGLVVGGESVVDFGDLRGLGGEGLVGGGFFEAGDAGGREVVMLAGEAQRLADGAVGEFGLAGGTARGGFLFGEVREPGFGGDQRFAGRCCLGVEFADLLVGLGELVFGILGVLEYQLLLLDAGPEFLGLGEGAVGRGDLLALIGQGGGGGVERGGGFLLVGDGRSEALLLILGAAQGDLGIAEGAAGALERRVRLRVAVVGEDFEKVRGDLAADLLVGRGLHDGGESVLLEALDEVGAVGGGVGAGVLAGGALPDPEMRPAGGQIVEAVGHAGGIPEDLREPFFRGIALEGETACGTQTGGAPGSGELLFDSPDLAAGLEAKADLGVPRVDLRSHRAQQVTAGAVAHEEGAVDGLGEGALAGFVGAADEVAGGVEVEREVAVDPVVADVEGKKAHGRGKAGMRKGEVVRPDGPARPSRKPPSGGRCGAGGGRGWRFPRRGPC
jgi:hypothetical protein